MREGATRSTVSVGPAPKGAWRVSTADDSFGGVFTSRRAALAFARDEAGWTKDRVVVEVPRRAADRGRGG